MNQLLTGNIEIQQYRIVHSDFYGVLGNIENVHKIEHFVRGWRKTWRRRQMETFSALLALCAGNSPVTGEFPAQRQVTRSFDVSFICAWINHWVNNREAGDLRRHRAHYGVIVMLSSGIALHYSDANVSQIAGNSHVVQLYVKARSFTIIKVPPYWPLAIGINQWPMNCLHKMPMIQKAFPC